MTSYSDTNIPLGRGKANNIRHQGTVRAETSFIEDGAEYSVKEKEGDHPLDESSRHASHSHLLATMDSSIDIRIEVEGSTPFLASDTLPSVRRVKAKNHFLQSSRGGSALASEQQSYRSHTEKTPLLLSTAKDEREAFKEIHQDYREEDFEVKKRVRLPGKCWKRCNFKLMKSILNHIKVAVLTLLLVLSIAFFVARPENAEEGIVLAVTSDQVEVVKFHESGIHQTKFITVSVKGPLDDQYSAKPCTKSSVDCRAETNFVVCTNATAITGGSMDMFCGSGDPGWTNGGCCLYIPLVSSCCNISMADIQNDINEVEFTFRSKDKANVDFTFSTQHQYIVPFTVSISGSDLDTTTQVILAAVILALVYVLIIFEFVHRSMAAIIGSTAALGVLSMLNQRSSLVEVLELIEWNTIWLLFGMMVLVAIFSQTGFFDWAAVKMYKIARGKTWPLIFLMCGFAGIVSAFLDNVTTILLLTPVSIRLSQVLNLDPRYVLIAEVIFSNIGGTATAIGDPPNVIIVSSKHIKEQNIGFNEFTVHMFIGIAFVFVLSFFFLRLVFCACCVRISIPEPQEVAELKRELAIWQRTAHRMQIVSLEERAVREALQAKARDVEEQLKEQFALYAVPTKEVWKSRLSDLEAKYTITDKNLLIRSSIVLLVVIILFFVSNAVAELHFELGWIAVFGAITLLMLADIHEIENILEKVEWGTLVFFAALFVLMELLTHLGLIDFIAQTTVKLIENVDPNEQMTIAMLLILWVSALASAFIDNIPFTTAIVSRTVTMPAVGRMY
jgi:Na+/H+ antiporter NhaD/arsenite permease-like protein